MSRKSRRRPVSTDKRFRKAAPYGDYGTTERWQHSGRTLERGAVPGVLVARATEEHVLDALVLRGLLDATQSSAAFKLKQDFQQAGLAAHTVSHYSAKIGSGDYAFGRRERTDAEEAAYTRWRRAVQSMGLGVGGVVVAVVCHDEAPAPIDIPHLQQGLDCLMKLYGMRREERAKEKDVKK